MLCFGVFHALHEKKTDQNHEKKNSICVLTAMMILQSDVL